MRQGAINKLINEGDDTTKSSSELTIRHQANHRKAANCKCLEGCNRAICSGEICNIHQPIKPKKPEKSDKCGSCGRELVVKMKVILGVCNPCYNKPETVERTKKRRQKRKRLEEHAPHRAALTPTMYGQVL
jgi:hypothetical protein